jgi:RNA polymerase sigma-70 factor, ECF subfamily
VIHAVIPRELAATLHPLLREQLKGDPSVDVVVDRRVGDRRTEWERRQAGGTLALGRRCGPRRHGDRRGVGLRVLPPADVPELPDEATPFLEQLVFIERVEPSNAEAEDLDTARLVRDLQGGVMGAFDALYLRYFDRVYGYLRLLLRDDHEAEDATQHVFVRLLEKVGSYEQRRQPFRAWLMRIAHNVGIDILRKTTKLKVVSAEELDSRRDGSDEGLASRPLEYVSDREVLALVEALPLLQRQVIVLHYLLGLRSVEVAPIIGRSPEAVRQLKRRALARLDSEASGAFGPAVTESSPRSLYG